MKNKLAVIAHGVFEPKCGRWRFFFVSALLIAVFYGTTGCSQKIKRGPANVLLISVDTLRADHLGAYGYQYIRTPVIDQLAAEGVMFERALTAVPITLPSHVTIMTGLYPPAHGVRDNNNFVVPKEIKTLAEMLRDGGYRTGAVVGSFVLDRAFGLDKGFDFYDDSGMGSHDNMQNVLFPERRADTVTDHALAWLFDNKEKRKPFFLWVHYYDPHVLYDPPPPFAEEYKTSPYDGEIAFVDQQLGRLLEGARKNSGSFPLMVVFVSDHGEDLGQHKEETHGLFVYNSTIHVPLIIAYKGKISGGAKIQTQVRTVDITPTILDILGLAVPAGMNGQSLLKLIEEKDKQGNRPAYMETELPFFHYGWSDLKAFSANGYVYIESPKPELYDMKNDFGEWHNLFSSQPDRAQNMSKLLAATEKKISLESFQKSARTQGISGDTARKLEALGYITSQPTGGTAENISNANRPVPADNVILHVEFMKAIQYMTEKKYPEAVNILKKLTLDDPHNINFRLFYGKALYFAGQQADARVILNRLLEKNPNYPDAMVFLADMEFELGNVRDAKALYERAQQLSPTDSSIITRLAKIAYKEGNIEKTKQLLMRSIELSPRNSEALDLMEALLTQEGNYNQIETLLERALEQSPSDTAIIGKLAKVRIKLGNRDGALELFRKIALLEPRSAEARYNLGAAMLLGKDGKPFGPGSDPKGALKLFYESIKLDPNLQRAREQIDLIKSSSK